MSSSSNDTPILDTTCFDSILLGTGLTNTILAGALARSGQRVLHLDGRSAYGSAFRTRTLQSFAQWLRKHQQKSNEQTDSTTSELENAIPSEEQRAAWIKAVKESLTGSGYNDATTAQALARCSFVPVIQTSDHECMDASFVDYTEQKQVEATAIDASTAASTSTSASATTSDAANSDSTSNTAAPSDTPASTSASISLSSSPSPLMRLSRRFNIDTFPQLVLSRSPLVDLLVAGAIHHYLEFKAVDASYFGREHEGPVASTATPAAPHASTAVHPLTDPSTAPRLTQLPLSKSSIFTSSSLTMIEKRLLMKFVHFILADDYHQSPEQQAQLDSERRKALDQPFEETMKQHKLNTKLKDMVKYALAMVELGDNGTASASTSSATPSSLSTREVLSRLRAFLCSVGRYGPGAFIYPSYGTSELPQAFSRLAAVHRGMYILRCAPVAIVYAEQMDGDGEDPLTAGMDPVVERKSSEESKGKSDDQEAITTSQEDASTSTSNEQPNGGDDSSSSSQPPPPLWPLQPNPSIPSLSPPSRKFVGIITGAGQGQLIRSKTLIAEPEYCQNQRGEAIRCAKGGDESVMKSTESTLNSIAAQGSNAPAFVSRCVLFLDGPLRSADPTVALSNSSLLAFAPVTQSNSNSGSNSNTSDSPIYGIQFSEEVCAAPSGKYVVYLWMASRKQHGISGARHNAQRLKRLAFRLTQPYQANRSEPETQASSDSAAQPTPNDRRPQLLAMGCYIQQLLQPAPYIPIAEVDKPMGSAVSDVASTSSSSTDATPSPSSSSPSSLVSFSSMFTPPFPSHPICSNFLSVCSPLPSVAVALDGAVEEARRCFAHLCPAAAVDLTAASDASANTVSTASVTTAQLLTGLGRALSSHANDTKNDEDMQLLEQMNIDQQQQQQQAQQSEQQDGSAHENQQQDEPQEGKKDATVTSVAGTDESSAAQPDVRPNQSADPTSDSGSVASARPPSNSASDA